jgi:hypothetical protein
MTAGTPVAGDLADGEFERAEQAVQEGFRRAGECFSVNGLLARLKAQDQYFVPAQIKRRSYSEGGCASSVTEHDAIKTQIVAGKERMPFEVTLYPEGFEVRAHGHLLVSREGLNNPRLREFYERTRDQLPEPGIFSCQDVE